MFDRVKCKEEAKRAMKANHNHSGMVGAQALETVLLYGFRTVVVLPLVSTISSLTTPVVLAGLLPGLMGIHSFYGIFIYLLSNIAFLILLSILGSVVSPLVSLISTAACAPVQVGLKRYYLHIKKNRTRTSVHSILEGFDHFWNLVMLAFAREFYVVRWAWLMEAVGGLVWGIIIGISIATESLAGLIIGLLILFLVQLAAGIWLYYMKLKTWPYMMVMADHPQLNAKQMIARCKEITKGHMGDLFVFELSFLGWRILNSLTGGILGIAYTDAYYNMACVEVYAALKGSPIALDDINGSLSSGGQTIPVHLNNEIPDRKPCLKGTVGSCRGYVFPLEPDKAVIIGRDAAQAAIVLTDEKVSRSHCSVRFVGAAQKYEIIDLSSRNGVYVNGHRLEANRPISLGRGTEIFLGSPDNNGFQLG